MLAVPTKHTADEARAKAEEAEASVEPPFEPLPERGPQRRCLVTGQVLPKEALLRFVVGPDNSLVPDPGNRLPGRGLWLTPERAIIRRAQTKGLFAKAAKASVKVPDDLLDRLVALERRRLFDLVGLARRAGLAVAGFEKVKAALSQGAVKVLLEADDGAEQGRERLAALARATVPGAVTLGGFSAEELGRALGRQHAVHVAIAPGAMAERMVQVADRLRALADETA